MRGRWDSGVPPGSRARPACLQPAWAVHVGPCSPPAGQGRPWPRQEGWRPGGAWELPGCFLPVCPVVPASRASSLEHVWGDSPAQDSEDPGNCRPGAEGHRAPRGLGRLLHWPVCVSVCPSFPARCVHERTLEPGLPRAVSDRKMSSRAGRPGWGWGGGHVASCPRKWVMPQRAEGEMNFLFKWLPEWAPFPSWSRSSTWKLLELDMGLRT